VKSFALLLCLSTFSWPAAAQTGAPLGQFRASAVGSPQIHPAVVRIIAPGKDSVSYGSGTLVAAGGRHGLVVTNWHVVNEATGQITVVFPDGFQSGASIQKIDRDWDLAALAIWRPSVPPVELAAEAPRAGETLTIAGYGPGSYRAASGPCTQYVAPGLKFPFEMVELAASARQGDSGGPILNSRGELAGVLFGEGGGRTAGSYCGRVRWFLASIAPPAESANGQIAQATSRPAARGRVLQSLIAQADPSDPASEKRPERPSNSFASHSPPTAGGRTPAEPQSAGPLAFSSPPPAREPAPAQPIADFQALPIASTTSEYPALTEPITVPLHADTEEPKQNEVGSLLGETRGELIKTILAACGALALIFHTLRLLAGQQTAK